MEAKFVYEGLGDLLAPKTEDEIISGIEDLDRVPERFKKFVLNKFKDGITEFKYKDFPILVNLLAEINAMPSYSAKFFDPWGIEVLGKYQHMGKKVMYNVGIWWKGPSDKMLDKAEEDNLEIAATMDHSILLYYLEDDKYYIDVSNNLREGWPEKVKDKQDVGYTDYVYDIEEKDLINTTIRKVQECDEASKSNVQKLIKHYTW